MKLKLTLLSTAALAAASQANAQGLLTIGHNAEADFERKSPLVWIVGAQVGWDSNPGIQSSNEQDSASISASIEATYASGDRRTAYNFHGSYSPLWYFDAPSNRDDFEHSARIGFDLRHRINPRLTITNSFYVAYEVEPDYQIGATTATNTDPYLYGHNSTALAYAWTRRFSTVSSYTLNGVWYDGVGNDYLAHTLANEFRYAISRKTTLAATYRFVMSDFETGVGDYDSHYVMLGVDQKFNPRLTASVRAGAEFREGDTSPYLETSLTYRVKKQTDLRWYTNYGFSSNGTDNGDNSHFRTGVTVSQQFNRRLTGSLGVHYVPQGDGFNEQDVFAASANFNYVLFHNLSLNGGYNFTTASSDNPFLEFDRHQFSLGVASQF